MINNSIDKGEINNLVKLVGQGDWDAFLELHNKMYNILFKFLLKYCYDKETIKDIISETFCIVIQKSKEKIFYVNCFSWILSIGKNQMINYIQKSKQVTYTDKMDSIESIENDVTTTTLNHEISKLDKNSRHLLYSLYCKKLTHKQISKIFKTSVSTIKRRKAEILNYLKEQIKDEEN